MLTFRAIAELPREWPRTVAAIGNFDGVHRGHQEIIGRVLERAHLLGAQAIAVTFDPHPVALLHPERAPKLITPMPQRLRLLEQTGLDATVVLPFTREFSWLSAREFAEKILRDALRVVEVHEGDTFRFGHDAAAGIAELKELGRELRFGVVSHGSLEVRDVTVSSSEIRRRIAAGQMSMARALLGRPFSILSTPARGRGVGTKLTTPTINLASYSGLLPPHGVYATRLRIGNGPSAPLLNGVTNAGVRPTFEGAGFAVESHLLDGPPPVELTDTTPLELCFLARIRDERRFPSPEALMEQIRRDAGWAQRYFRRADLSERIPDPTDPIREAYDRVADEYARRLFDELHAKPLDCTLLDRFAADVGQGLVCDMGCGPGHVARYLHNAGADVFGLDLSPGMLDQARRLNPELRFREGNLLALPLDDSSLAGITAFYAIVNLPWSTLPTVFREMYRVLRSGGLLLLAFHVGDERRHVEELWDRRVSLDFHFFQPASIRHLLEAAGFQIEEIVEREPYAPDVEHQSRRAYIFARKPAASVSAS